MLCLALLLIRKSTKCCSYSEIDSPAYTACKLALTPQSQKLPFSSCSHQSPRLQELDDKLKQLHEQRLKQLSLDRECSRLRQDLDRIAVLQPLLDGESLAMMHSLSFSQREFACVSLFGKRAWTLSCTCCFFTRGAMLLSNRFITTSGFNISS